LSRRIVLRPTGSIEVPEAIRRIWDWIPSCVLLLSQVRTRSTDRQPALPLCVNTSRQLLQLPALARCRFRVGDNSTGVESTGVA
jgi:hypothetical protein